MPARAEHSLVGSVGHDLHRPECVLAHASGLLFVPDWSGTGGVAAITPDGDVHRFLARITDDGGASDEDTGEGVPCPLRPNGIALEAGGSFLLAHLGERSGGIFRLRANGRVEPVVTTIEGAPMPPANFVVADALDRLWITVSTRLTPRAADYRAGAASGFVALARPGESDARIVADGLGYANECVIDTARKFLFVNETFGRRLTRFALAADGSLTERHVLARFGEGTYPDGLALDEEGALLVTSIVSNRVLRVMPDGAVRTLLEDADVAHVARVEAAYRADALAREHLDVGGETTLRNVSNLAFGGPDMRTAWLGNLLGDTIPCLRLEVPGVVMPHYRVPLGPLARLIGDGGTFTEPVR